MCNAYQFSMETMVSRRCLNVTFVCTLRVLLLHLLFAIICFTRYHSLYGTILTLVCPTLQGAWPIGRSWVGLPHVLLRQGGADLVSGLLYSNFRFRLWAVVKRYKLSLVTPWRDTENEGITAFHSWLEDWLEAFNFTPRPLCPGENSG